MWVLVVFILYLMGLVALGVYCARLNRTLADFVLGGRRLGVWVTAISAQASDMSGWLLIGLPATAFAIGLSAVWVVAGCTAGAVFNWLVIAPRLRRETGAAGALTIPDYLAGRYGEGPLRLVRVASVAVILLAYATYIAAQFMAAGKIFETTFAHVETPWGVLGLGYHEGMLIGVGIIMLYTAMGGFLAVAWTDLVQGLLMVLTVVVLPIVGLAGLGGMTVLGGRLAELDPALLTVTQGKSGLAFVMGVAVAGLSWGLGYPGQPHILARFMALKDPKAMRRAAVLGITWAGLALTGAMMLGLVGRAMLHELADTDHVMPTLAVRLVHPLVAGVMIAGAVAAIMSTVDSQLLVAVSAVEEDIYIRLLGGKPQDRGAVWFGRLTVLGLGAAALPIAWPRESVFSTVFDAWGVLAAGIGPLVILGLLTRRTNAWGAMAGILAGTVVAQGWPWVKPAFGGDVLFENGLIPGFVLNLALAYGVSLLAGGRGGTSPPRQSKR